MVSCTLTDFSIGPAISASLRQWGRGGGLGGLQTLTFALTNPFIEFTKILTIISPPYHRRTRVNLVSNMSFFQHLYYHFAGSDIIMSKSFNIDKFNSPNSWVVCGWKCSFTSWPLRTWLNKGAFSDDEIWSLYGGAAIIRDE